MQSSGVLPHQTLWVNSNHQNPSTKLDFGIWNMLGAPPGPQNKFNRLWWAAEQGIAGDIIPNTN